MQIQDLGQTHYLVSFGCPEPTAVSSLEAINISFLFKKTNLILKLFKPGKKVYGKKNFS